MAVCGGYVVLEWLACDEVANQGSVAMVMCTEAPLDGGTSLRKQRAAVYTFIITDMCFKVLPCWLIGIFNSYSIYILFYIFTGILTNISINITNPPIEY